MGHKEHFAIIDIGSNTVRLVIYAKDQGGHFKEADNVKAVARLRNYLNEDHVLEEEGIKILLKTLKSFKEVTDTYNLQQLLCVATATVRQAENQEEILHRVEGEIGFSLRVLSEQEEAYYGYLAVVNSTSVEEGVTVDIGGGSTEVTYYENRQIKHSHSFPFGALSLKSMFVKNDMPTEQEMDKLKRYLTDQFLSLPWIKNKKVPLIGIGGSARNLVQVDQALKSYPLSGVHQYKMQDNDIGFIKNYLLTLNFKKLQKVEGLSKDRADIILPAIQVFQTLYDVSQASSFVLSRKGLRDGVFYEELLRGVEIDRFPNVVEESFNEMANDFDIDLKHVQHVTDLSMEMFEQFRRNGIGHITNDDKWLLKRAAFVFNLGDYIDSESSSQHTFYMLANRTIDGLLHQDRLKLALVASFKSKSIFKQYLEPYKHWFVKQEQKKLRMIGSLIKFAYSLDSTRRQIVRDLTISFEKDEIVMDVTCDQESMPEEYQVEKQKKHLEKSLKQKVTTNFYYVKG
ncbi:exopolyphosphatase [Pontibacillus halophilus JSM 076056 = DSM 19796]|uniref:Exopolyphosphatase n=1 Tax=Pontibacillus halophilus JSM 076056 = DSM 19796 TaxID=1385510 RepID=A0A0A5I4D1_9BACI|nr:exopolyphosphatase [Pontibacillus halophilus JSM 076056 = DSM 19796]